MLIGAIAVAVCFTSVGMSTEGLANDGYDAYRRLVVQASLYKRLGRTARAAEALIEAYKHYADESVLLRAVSYLRSASEQERALRLAERYLTVSRADTGRREARRHIAELRSRMSRYSAEIEIRTKPAGATVCREYLDAKTASERETICTKPPIVRWLKAGRTLLVVKHKDFDVRKYVLVVKSGQHVKVTVPLHKRIARGRVDVFSRFRGAEVYIDGRHRGKTPLTSVVVKATKHVVEVRRATRQVWRGEITVRAGRTTTIYAGFSPPKAPVVKAVTPTIGPLLTEAPPVEMSARSVPIPKVASVRPPAPDVSNTPVVASKSKTSKSNTSKEPDEPDDDVVVLPPTKPQVAKAEPSKPANEPDTAKSSEPPKIDEPDDVKKTPFERSPEKPDSDDEDSKGGGEPPTVPEKQDDTGSPDLEKPDSDEPDIEPDDAPDNDTDSEPDGGGDPGQPDGDDDDETDLEPSGAQTNDGGDDSGDIELRSGTTTRWNRIMGWSSLGVGVAMVGGAVATGLMAISTAEEANLGNPLASNYRKKFDSLLAKAETEVLLTNIFFSTGGALIATGVTLLILDAIKGTGFASSGSERHFTIDAVPQRGGFLVRTSIDF
jgi:hypothetical protein